MQPDKSNRQLWIALLLISGVPRLVGAFLLPNSFGDAYAYIRGIEVMRAKMLAGTFSIDDLYGYWLTFYQFLCAVLSVVFGSPFYVGKVVSSIFGIGVCLLVYVITFRLTANRTAALLSFLLVALNPLHVFTSTSALTDIPSAFFILAALYFSLHKRWIPAAIFGTLAGLTRIDNWMLIALIPLLQILEEKRMSLAGLAILLFPPLFWFWISWKARGHWLACFIERKHYMDALLAANPSIASFSVTGVLRDTAALLVAVDVPVIIACFVAAWFIVKRFSRLANEDKGEEFYPVLKISAFFFAFLSFIVLAYVTHKQPVIFSRYGLTHFALGAPLLPWAFLRITQSKPQWKRKLLVSIIVLCCFEASVQFAGSVGFINKQHTHGTVGEYLRNNFKAASDSHIFSDDGTVNVYSGFPEQTFLSSYDAPRDRDGFLNFIRDRNVEYLVFVDKEDATPSKLFPELKNGQGNEFFQPIMHATSRFLTTDIWLYQVRREAIQNRSR